MQRLTLQIATSSGWQDAATLEIPQPEQGSRGACRIAYDTEYALNTDRYEQNGIAALSVNLPVSIVPYEFDHWPALLDDIMPAGASRRWWVNRLDLL